MQVQPAPTYREVAERYNANLRGVEQLWARAVIELEWEDDKGKHFEQGDGHLIVAMPDRLALSLGKLGDTLFWAGSDTERYWLFDLRNRHEVYVGRQGRPVGFERYADRLRFPISPSDLLRLLGVLPMATGEAATGRVERGENGQWAVEPGGGSLRFFVDEKTFRPSRIQVLDTWGNPLAEAKLSRWKPMALSGVGPGDFPLVATSIEMCETGRDGTMTLFLSSVTDGKENGKIKPKVFEFDQLRGLFKPEKVIDLDAPG
jgi:hypothetical protein